MGELIDKTKGRIKQGIGGLTGDRELQGEGVIDETKGKVKGGFEEAKQAVKDAVRPPPERNK